MQPKVFLNVFSTHFLIDFYYRWTKAGKLFYKSVKILHDHAEKLILFVNVLRHWQLENTLLQNEIQFLYLCLFCPLA